MDKEIDQILKNTICLTAILVWLHGKGLYEECEKDLGLNKMMGIDEPLKKD